MAQVPAVEATLPDRSVVPPVWSRYTNLIIDRGEGSWLVTVDGERYLDYTCGIGVTNTGHAHPRVVAAIQEQAARLLHGQQNIVYHVPGLRLYERLSRLLPGDGWGAFLTNSGAEAVEAAIKLARVATGRPAIISFRGGFHGRTAQTMALTSSKYGMRSDFEPLPGSVYMTRYPYCYRSSAGAHAPEACVCDWEQELELLFQQVIDPGRVAGIIVEPVQGESGYIVPPPDFLPRLREITRRHGIFLIADEIQCGMGRTGAMFAVQHAGVEPDIVVFAKGIASGLPLSGIIARRTAIEAWKPGSHGGTYGGNVVACAAALATLDVIEDEGLLLNARERGRQLLEGLRAVARTCPDVGDVRGLGLMVGMEFVRADAPDPRTPNGQLAAKVIAGALARKLLLLPCGTWGQSIRFIPPLITTAEEVDRAVSIVADALREATAAAGAS